VIAFRSDGLDHGVVIAEGLLIGEVDPLALRRAGRRPGEPALGEALTLAKRKPAATEQWRPPLFWAPFALVGS